MLEVVRFGSGEVTEIQVGLDYAEARVRSRFVAGHIEVEEFEAEIGRLLTKRHTA